MDSLNIDFKKKSVKGKLSIKVFKDGDFWIAYVPSLDISGYAENAEDAKKFLFDVYLPEYFDNLLSNPHDAVEDLSGLGWKRNPILKKQFVSDSYIDKDGFLQEFNLPLDTEVIETELTV